MVEDTNRLDVNEKSCSRCGEKKETDKFIKNRNICKECNNKRRKDKYHSVLVTDEVTQKCSTCDIKKQLSSFIKNKIICKDCNNAARKLKYHNDQEHRLMIKVQGRIYKQKKTIERRAKKLAEIGEGNKKCSKCFQIKLNNRFRHNRLKCKDCERDEPKDKFRRVIRSRIWGALIRKTKKTIEYLGCNHEIYIQWILCNNNDYNLENHGSDWHIDHVIPLYHFDLENEEEQLLAFNWRNTMPLSVKDNLSKNNKIIKPQIEQHVNHLLNYHKEKNIEMPQKFIDLFAKHLDAGSP